MDSVYVLFEFILDYRIVGDLTVVVAVLTVLAIWIHRWGHHDFGKGYRIVIGALGLSLALFAVLRRFDFPDIGFDEFRPVPQFQHHFGRKFRLTGYPVGIHDRERVPGYGCCRRGFSRHTPRSHS